MRTVVIQDGRREQQAPAEAAVRGAGIVRRYGEGDTTVHALRGVDLEVQTGQLTAVMGPSGSGKSTLMHILAGLDEPDGGQVWIGETEVTGLDDAGLTALRRDHIGFIFQFFNLLPMLTAQENVLLPLEIAGRKPDADWYRELIAKVGLGERLSHRPSEMSGGQQQRVAVARALVLEPQVLLFDEPLSNLDAKLRRRVREEIRDLQQRLSLTVVYVTHDQSEAMAVSDRIIVMNKAAIAQEGAPRELYEQPRDVFVAGFMGDANRVRGTLARVDAALGELSIGPLKLRLPHRGLSGEVDVAVRPEAIELALPGEPGLAGTVRKAAYIGGVMEYTIGTAVGDLFVVNMAVDRPLSAGAEVMLKLANHGVVPIAGV